MPSAMNKALINPRISDLAGAAHPQTTVTEGQDSVVMEVSGRWVGRVPEGVVTEGSSAQCQLLSVSVRALQRQSQ